MSIIIIYIGNAIRTFEFKVSDVTILYNISKVLMLGLYKFMTWVKILKKCFLKMYLNVSCEKHLIKKNMVEMWLAITPKNINIIII